MGVAIGFIVLGVATILVLAYIIWSATNESKARGTRGLDDDDGMSS